MLQDLQGPILNHGYGTKNGVLPRIFIADDPQSTSYRSQNWSRISPITVLLADDSASVRMAIKHLLKMEPGITFGEAANLQEALAMCAELKPDVILPDLHMPRELDAQYVKTKLLDCAVRFGYVRLERRPIAGTGKSLRCRNAP